MTRVGERAEEQHAHGDAAVLVGSERACAQDLDRVVDALGVRARRRVAAGRQVEPRGDDVVLGAAAEESEHPGVVDVVLRQAVPCRQVASDRAQQPAVVLGEGERGTLHPVADTEPVEGHGALSLGLHGQLVDRRTVPGTVLEGALREEVRERVPEELVLQPIEEGDGVHATCRRAASDLVARSRTSRQALDFRPATEQERAIPVQWAVGFDGPFAEEGSPPAKTGHGMAVGRTPSCTRLSRRRA